MKLEAGRVAFVTGGASGIGFSLGHAFADRGLRVALADIDADTLEQSVSRLRATGATVESVVLNVTDAESWRGAADHIWDVFGGVDVLCNNAGIGQGRRPGRGSSLLDLDELTWRTVLDVNATGAFLGVREFVPRMIAGGNPGGVAGHVVMTASMAGLIAPGGLGAYAASKFAVVALSESLRAELAPHGIGVSVLCPGGVESNLDANSEARHAASRGTDPHETRPIPVTLMAASSVAARVLASIEANALYITTHPEYRDLVAERFEAVLAGFATSAEPGYFDPEPFVRSVRNPAYAEALALTRDPTPKV